ncbi:TonB-dependent receptor [Aquisalinus flavus]|uniref:Autotransporter domain-containing protein n=1 Tax=Aquisalinus flavus TaxID=1526572 RepID=A0A8J2Y861_9PROT|nr:TonB-dependent receptor [Aquisalinus flavus]MBD0425650.1 hypothetical protein [Aquisalinus flavus]UNE48734.1 hypothetical protein FF099_12070 [Aquisalinus flavus]GGD14346.1 hypothetical protein GCM10011342_23920 [Aquisalinus flavus]
MISLRKLTAACLAATGTLAGVMLGTASAQTIGDLESAVTQGAQFEEAQRQAEQFRRPSDEEAMLEGEPGVFILRVNEIFHVGAAAGLGYSTNPGRTLDVNAEESGFSNFALSAGINTLIGGHVDAGVNLVVSGTDYFETNEIDNKNAIVSTYVGTSVLNDRVYVTAGANYGTSGDGNFSDTTDFSGVSASASTVFQVRQKVLVQPTLTVSRQLSQNEAQENTAVTAAVRAIWAPTENWRVAADVAYTDRSYDNFYEDVTFVEREDEVWSAGVAVTRSIAPDLQVTASIGYTEQASAFFLSEYDAVDGGLNLRLSKRF